MQKGLSIKIMKELAQVGQERGINFKDKYFYHEDMTCKIDGYWIPITIHELMTVLPRSICIAGEVCNISMGWSEANNDWVAYYLHAYMMQKDLIRAPNLVDALGKLLIWAIKEGWVKE